jgi:hypothetical protein
VNDKQYTCSIFTIYSIHISFHCQAGTINISTFRKAAAEWRYCQYEVDKLQEIRYIYCSPCSVSQHSAHLDGNQKLYQFRSVPRYADRA